MNCRVCGNSFFAGRAVFHCSCGAFVHASCWEKHVIEAHRPPFVLGTVDLDGKFVARKTEINGRALSSIEKETAGVT